MKSRWHGRWKRRKWNCRCATSGTGRRYCQWRRSVHLTTPPASTERLDLLRGYSRQDSSTFYDRRRFDTSHGTTGPCKRADWIKLNDRLSRCDNIFSCFPGSPIAPYERWKIEQERSTVPSDRRTDKVETTCLNDHLQDKFNLLSFFLSYVLSLLFTDVT